VAERPHQPRATRGTAIKTEPRCKICRSPWRGEIEDLLAIYSERGSLDDGTRVTGDWLKSVAPERWEMKLNDPNIQSHLQRHFQVGRPENSALQRDARMALQEKSQAGDIEKVAVDDFLEDIIGIGREKARLDPNSVTIDHALKAAAELTKRKADDSRQRLMEQVIAGRSRSLGLEQQNAIVVDAVVVEEVVDAAE
jgi:hypothetical protein